MKFVRSLIFSGIDSATTPSAKRGVQLANSIGLILFVLSLVTDVLYYIWYGWNQLTLLIPVIGSLALFTVLFNRFALTSLSRVWISLGPPVFITLLSIYSKSVYYDRQEELDYFTFRIVMLGSCVIPWVIFSLKERKALFISSFLGLAILLFHDPLHSAFGVPYMQDKLKVINYYFTNIVIFITFAILIGSLAFLKWISEKNEDQNIELINDLNNTNEVLIERNTEIESQSAEILAQSDVLQSNQEQLLEANRLIDRQRELLFSRNQSLESELIERNADLTETNSELIKHNNELRQFSYTVSHNLRGPVASLLGLINLINSEKLDENDQEVFSYIATSAEHLDQIIRDLSKIIDIRHDIFKIRQKIDLNSEVDDVIKVLRREFEEHQVLLLKNIESCSQVYSIKPMVNSILYNLLSNAIKYRSSERQLVIEITTREENGFYVLEVADNGLGIDLQHNRDSLFKLYKRFHFHTEGKGLGLYLIKLQCEALGGSVEIESEINRFAKFIVRLQKPANIDRQVLYQERHAEIFFDARINATGVIWKGPVTSAEYRTVFTKCLDFVHSYNTPNYIADISCQGPISKADQKWMYNEILPFAIHHGLKKICVVHDNLSDPGVSEYLAGIQSELTNLRAAQRFFTSMNDAFDWISHENERATLQMT